MPTLHYETPSRIADGGTALVVVILLTVVGTPMWAILFPGLVSELPRPMQGESVTIPFVVCKMVYLAVPVLVPTVFLRTSSARLRGVVCLSALAFGWYCGLGFEDLLSKAWRRGL